MTERQMEDLIARFPDEFFRGHGLVLKGRQQSFAEVGRFDLFFVDSFQTNVLMELKARVAKYEDASQLAKYKDALNQRGERNILMWLVAPHIPNSVREFLDRIGIEYSEIHEAQFRRVAERHGVSLENEEPPAIPAKEGRRGTSPREVSVHRPRAESPYKLNPNFDRTELDRLLRTFSSAVRRQIDRSIADKLRRELLDTTPPTISWGTTGQLAKWCKTNNPLYWEGMEVAQKISQLLFGTVLDRTLLGV
jgi:Endonuclease NucS